MSVLVSVGSGHGFNQAAGPRRASDAKARDHAQKFAPRDQMMGPKGSRKLYQRRRTSCVGPTVITREDKRGGLLQRHFARQFDLAGGTAHIDLEVAWIGTPAVACHVVIRKRTAIEIDLHPSCLVRLEI